MKVEKAMRIANKYWGFMNSSQGVPYMRHIEQGVQILDYIYSNNPDDEDLKDAKVAFILHGLFQEGNMLATVGRFLYNRLSSKEMMLVMEYRNVANSYLREHVNDPGKAPPKYYAIPVVEDMLVADKIQNYDNFVKHYKGKHVHTDELERYFLEWFESLGMSLPAVNQIRRLCCNDT